MDIAPVKREHWRVSRQAGECGVKQRPVEAAEYDRHSYNQQRHTQEPGREFYQRRSLVS